MAMKELLHALILPGIALVLFVIGLAWIAVSDAKWVEKKREEWNKNKFE
jgi:hypothetical protein